MRSARFLTGVCRCVAGRLDGTPAGAQSKPVHSDMEAEVDETAVGKPDAGA